MTAIPLNGVERPRYRALGPNRLEELARRMPIDSERLLEMQAVALVLPFRTNEYVVDQLIDWTNVPEDPLFQLTFPQPGMLEDADLLLLKGMLRSGSPREKIAAEVARIRRELNPHPSGQMDLNTAYDRDGAALAGCQHKYRETILYFPSMGQTCHAYCTYCFRWAQFIGDESLRFASKDVSPLKRYLADHPEVSEVLVTGGDPLIMSADRLATVVEPLLDPRLESLDTIRIGTKSFAYWPMRFTSDRDADALLGLFERAEAAGKRITIMAHFTHPHELQPEEARRGLARVRATGATVYCQAPVVRHVNAAADVLADLWREERKLGCVPYYLFVERDTGARRYFELTLEEAYSLYRDAVSSVSGLVRTVRGPVMSATPGKVIIDGIADFSGEKVFVLRFLQGRDARWVGRPFFARFDETAVWFDDLEPAAGETSFFFESEPSTERSAGDSGGSARPTAVAYA
jgi:L-lysine 2,3-aminomutase